MFVLLVLALTVAACGPKGDGGVSAEADRVTSASAAQAGTSGAKSLTLRIGYQKYGTLNILKVDGGLDQRLNEIGVRVEWTEFPGGPQLLEALNVGSIDIGHAGEAPPIFAQAAGAPLVYLAHEPANPAGEALLVPKDSEIASVADLKGKTVVLNKGSNVHYLLVRLLERAGVDSGMWT